MRIFVSFLLFMNTVIFFGCGDPGRATTMMGSVDDRTVEQPAPVVPPDGMVLIPAGSFQMGSDDPEAFDDEQPVRSVYVDNFYMDKYEVTNARYREFVLANPRWQKNRIAAGFADENYLKHWNENNYPIGKRDHPVIYVSWHAADAYAKWAGKRLPTEREWEKAARGDLVNQKYPQGSSIDVNKANYGLNVGETKAVGQYPANGYGLHDMAGNVWEWCSDKYDNVEDSHVLRGGSWLDTARFVRVSARGWSTPSFTSAYIGFRCVRDMIP